MALYHNLLVLAGLVLAMVLLRTIRRPGGPRGYAAVLGLQLVLAFTAIVYEDRYLGTVVICLCGLTVVAPALLERGARQMFALGRPRLAVRLSGLRAMLMPGAGLGRQQQILRGFALLDRDGVDAALAHFRGLVAAAEEPAELAVIHEQIVAMLLFDHRWSEAVTHYESHFHPSYAAVRPTLALGILRAFGELGRHDAAAALLRSIEDGPLGSEAGAAELLAQARLTFLAHSGALGVVEDALVRDRGRRLGLSPGTATLFLGIAAARAGDPQRADALLQQVPGLARRSETRLAAAARTVRAHVDEPAPAFDDDLQEFVQAVGERFRAALRERGGARRLQPLIMTTALIAVSAGWYVVTLAAGWAGVGLLRAGALTGELWRAGSWGRLFTAPFVHADLVGLLLDCYSIWLAGHVLERIHGWARTGLIAILGSAAGMWAAAVADPDPAQVIGGGNALAVAVLVATLWTLLPARTPGLLSTVRRSVVLTLLFLLGAHVFACIPGVYGLRSTPLSLGTAAFVASALTLLLPPTLPGWTRKPLAGLCLAAIAVVGLGAVQVSREDPIAFAAAHRELRVVENGVALALPTSFERVEAGERRHPLLQVFPGWLDTQALRGGHLVEFVVVPDAPAEGSALFVLAPALAHELVLRPEADPEAAFAGFTNYTLQRNGETIARLVERRLGDHAVLLLAAPAAALDPAAALYSAILGDAVRAD
ncbi:rhomboid family intramembrane serine protease [Nannocystis bainbridge]|uniref:Rhomboid family intramembrane serine protease n=1 Tax=Nannocystis bainbridge TaxID=2995303 RepID=A0ABT5E0S3_9BACT|nr:rhomboid family intramembrane serine protease [Nannocystis bainbridge]MDC0719468.1 rhomboid family intramembrane serine protease [Nannocystis bainbridge]